MDTIILKSMSAKHLWNIYGSYEIWLSRSHFEIKDGDNVIKAINDIERCINEKNSLREISKKIGVANVVRILLICFKKSLNEYLEYYASLFTEERDIINYDKFCRRVFNENLGRLCQAGDTVNFKRIICNVVNDEYEKQCRLFIATNKQQMRLDNDLWKLYWLQGTKLYYAQYNFMEITPSLLRNEVKLYFKKEFYDKSRYGDKGKWSKVISSFSYIVQKNSEVKRAADINKIDVENLFLYLQFEAVSYMKEALSPSTICKSITYCKAVINFLIEYYSDKKDNYNLPKYNWFSQYDFHNIHNLHERTLEIPEEVDKQILNKLNKLELIYQRIYKIFMGTGLRAKELAELTEECIYFNEKEKVWVLRYIPWKVLKQRRISGLSDYHEIIIEEELTNCIFEQIDETKELRKKYNLPYIFLKNCVYRSGRPSIVNMSMFSEAINKLMREEDILTNEGCKWNFTTRQCRKTLAIIMIENGATSQEVANQLGHFSDYTTNKYYAEVREAKLADMNSEFFKKKFDLTIGSEQLQQFTEEERRALYVDFCISNREVELGACTKHFAMGVCGNITGKSNCATCSNLCTGGKYIGKWIKLRDSQKRIVDELVRCYTRNNIEDYKSFVNYKREKYLFDIYDEVVNKITKSNDIGESLL